VNTDAPFLAFSGGGVSVVTITGAHAFVRTERVVQSTARTCAVTMKLCLTAVGAAVTAREKRNQIATTPRPKKTIALVSREQENSVGDLAIEAAILL